MSWQDQGRQEHGWFGHGTSGVSHVSAARQTAERVAYAAYGHLPSGQRAIYERWLDHGGLQQVAAVLPGWAAGAHLPEDRFRAMMFGPHVSDQVATQAHAVGLTLALTSVRTQSAVEAAGRRFAALTMAVLPEAIGRVIADAAAQAESVSVRNLVAQTNATPTDYTSRTAITPVVLKCDGFEAGCGKGGTYGSSGMYRSGDRNLCGECAVKYLGIQDMPAVEQIRILSNYLIRA